MEHGHRRAAANRLPVGRVAEVDRRALRQESPHGRRRGRRASPEFRLQGRRRRSPRARHPRRVAIATPRAIAAAVSAETAPCSREASRGNAELVLLDPIRVRDDAAEEDVARAGNGVSRSATSPPVHDSAVPIVSPSARQRASTISSTGRSSSANTYRSCSREERRESSSARASAPGSTKMSTWISKSRAQTVTSTPSPSPPASAVSARRLTR